MAQVKQVRLRESVCIVSSHQLVLSTAESQKLLRLYATVQSMEC